MSGASILRCKAPPAAIFCSVCTASPADKARVKALPWAGVTRATLGGYDLVVARTGYTGERVAFELFVNPDQGSGAVQGSGRGRRDSDWAGRA